MSGKRTRRAASTRVEHEARRRHERARARLSRARTQTRRRGVSRRALWGGVFVAALLVGWGVTGLSFPEGFDPTAGALRLDQIRVQGHVYLSAAEVAATTGIAPGSPFSTIERTVVEERMREHPWIRDAHALALPIGTSGRLWVQVEERVPAAALVARDGTQPVWVDATGTPFAATTPDAARQLPTIRAKLPFELGEPRAELVQATLLIADLREHGLTTPFELALPEDGKAEGWVLRFGEPQREVVFGREGLARRVQELTALFGSELSEVKQAERLDLRFDGRAVLVLADWGVRGKSASR